jgi:glucan phosphoethanolaminetransferase (alkaline phosphatase superfamily)
MDSEDPRIPVNYFYFGLFFAILIFLFSSEMWAHPHLSGSRFFFFLYAIGQAILEVSLFAFIGWIIRRFLGSKCFYAFIGATFIILSLHIIDFMVGRVLDLSVFETLLVFVLEQTPEQFLYLIDASGVPYWGWVLFFFLVGITPFIGIYLYKVLYLATRKHPLFIKREWFLQLFICVPFALLLWDFSASKIIHPDTYTVFAKSLPWKMTLLQPESVQMPLARSLQEHAPEQQMRESIAQNQTVLSNKPNIYLFVVESFREDFVTPEIAPHLSAFRQANTHFNMALSNANATNLSWFSIFHSQFPYFWHRIQKGGWEMGSPALNLLKKWGYQIHVLSSAELSYFGMEDLLFGKNRHLLTTYKKFCHAPPVKAADSDGATLEYLQTEMAKNPSLEQGQVFIIFWDSTHFSYSWPEHQPPFFTPISSDIAYFRAFQSKKNIEPIKNRYRNSIRYVDTLFGNFLKNLPQKEEAIIIVTGDHGEEFYEKGHLFHGSHLIHEQTNVPLYMRFGEGKRKILEREMFSQMDIFPSVIDYLQGEPVSFLEGSSVFRENQWPYVFMARFNASQTPYEFCIHNGAHKLIARFSEKRNIFDSKALQILFLRSSKDQSLQEYPKEIHQWVQKEFGPALDRLFDSATASKDL